MGTNIPAAMQAEVDGLNRTHWVGELTSGATTLRYADHPVASESEGVYKSYIPPNGWGDIVSDLGDRSFSLVDSRSTFRFFDADRSFQHLLAESAGGNLLDATFEVWLRSFFVDAANHYRRILGRVRNYRLVADRTWQIVYGPNDDQIGEPLRFNPISKSEHEVNFGSGGGNSVPDEAAGNPTQVVYGFWNSIGTGVNGMIPASFQAFDEANDINYWFASWGRLKEVPRIFAGDTDKTTDFTISNPSTPTGKVYTRFNADVADVPSTDAVRFDCTGLTDDGLTTGVTIENPATMLRHILVNFVFQQWDGSTFWMPETGLPLDTGLFDKAKDFFDLHGVTASGAFTTATDARAIINLFGSSLLMNTFWTTEFNLAALVDDFGARDTYLTSTEHLRQDKGHFRGEDGKVSPLKMESGGDELVRDLVVSSAFSAGGSHNRQRLVGVESLRKQQALDIRVSRASLVG